MAGVHYDKITNKAYYCNEGSSFDDQSGTSFITFCVDNMKMGDGEKKKISYQNPESGVERGGWGNKLDFLFSCISLSVGLGNVWRFPYLCYKNGGGTFLIIYSIAMIFCGIPMFYQEVAIGQYLGSGGMTFVGQLVPLLKGVGYATMTIVFLLDVYYCIIIAWTLFYIINTFVVLPDLPWSNCDNWWNTKDCFMPNHTANAANATGAINMSMQAENMSMQANLSQIAANLTRHKTTTPVEEFFDHRLLGITKGIHEIGGMQWELFGCLVIGWICIYGIIRKGLHQSGKIIWFTAIFPYVILLILLVRAVTLEGAVDGLLYYVTPRWEKLLTAGPWLDGATQIFFAYSIGCGALPALGSYNKFHHNCYKDAIITCVINTLTSLLAGCVTFSILGHIANEQSSDVGDVVKVGPGLVFLTYPEVVLKLPGAPFWAATFFIMLLTLGIDSEFCLVESFITGVLDNWSETLRPHRTKFTVAICVIMFLLGVPMVTHGGMYIFQLMDYFSASGMSLLWVCFFQTIAISWIFGVDKLSDCIEQMVGIRPNKFWTICWQYCAPLVMMAIFVFQCIQFQPLTYGNNYKYPDWADACGFLLSLSSMVWVPLYAIYYVLSRPGSIIENIYLGLRPQIKPRRISIHDKQSGLLISESTIIDAETLTPNTSFLVPSK